MWKTRIYRDVYKIDFSPITGETYTPANVSGISASTVNLSTSATTENLVVFNESVGRYYVELNSILYTFDDTYEVRWFVIYTESAPVKTLVTRFRIRPFNFTGGVIAEVVDNGIIIEIGHEA